MTTVDGRDQQDARGAAEFYAEELRNLGQLQASQQRRERLLGYSKLLIAAATLVAALFLPRHIEAFALLAAPVAAFIVLAVLQEKLLASIRYRTRAIAFYERGLARLNDQWAGSGETGERFLDPSHPYARDLDLFGPASLFEYLSSARTRAGEETLARWLLAPAHPDEVLARQAAVRELRARVKFRERLFSAGETVRLGVHPEALSAWGESSPVFTQRNVRVLVSVLAILWILSIVGWALWDLPVLALLMTILNFAYAHRLHARLEKAAAALESATQDLQLLAEVLRLFEQEQVASPRLLALQAALRRDGITSSEAIGKLARLVDLLQSRHSLFAQAARPGDVLERATGLCRGALATEVWSRNSRMDRCSRRTRGSYFAFSIRLRASAARVSGVCEAPLRCSTQKAWRILCCLPAMPWKMT